MFVVGLSASALTGGRVETMIFVGREPGLGGGGDSKNESGKEEDDVCRDLDEDAEDVEQLEDTELERTREERGEEDEDAARVEAAGGGGRGSAE